MTTPTEVSAALSVWQQHCVEPLPASPAQDGSEESLLLPEIDVVLCAAYVSDPCCYPGGFNGVFSAGFLHDFVPLNTATMLALDEHHGGLPVCLALQPDSRGTLDLFYHDLSGAGGTQRMGVPPRFLLEDDLPDLIRWAKTEIFKEIHLPKGSLSPYAPVELIIRLPRAWYATKRRQPNCVLFMPHFMASTERSEEQGVVTMITECLAGYLQSARTVHAKFVICYPREQNPVLSVVAGALTNAASNYGKSPMRLNRRVLGVTYGSGRLHQKFKSASLSILGAENGLLMLYAAMAQGVPC